MKSFYCLMLSLSLCACKSVTSFLAGDAAEPTYAVDANENLRLGKKALDSKNYVEAQKYFDYVKSKYPYLDAATTAELLLADVDFDREKYIEARDRYSNFVKLHPTHSKVDYAAFRAALTHVKEMPSNFFVLPPSSEKDQAAVRGAKIALTDFLRSYPKSEFVAEAEKNLIQVKKKMADHELYAARFYSRRGRWPAVVQRLGVMAKEYGDVGYEEQIYFGLRDAYENIQKNAEQDIKKSNEDIARLQQQLDQLKDKATDRDRQNLTDAQARLARAQQSKEQATGQPDAVLRELIEKYPNSSAAKRAKRTLGL